MKTTKNTKKIDIKQIDFRNVALLSKYINQSGRLMTRRHNKTSAKEQRKIEQEVKRARYMALLPYIKQ